MKRQNALSLLTFSLLLGGATQAMPHLSTDSNVLDAVVAPAFEETTIKGEIRSVDADNGSFTLVEGEKVHAIKIGDMTKITLDGKEVPAKDALARGRKAVVVKDGDVIKSVAVHSDRG